MGAVIRCANAGLSCPAGSCLLSLRRQDELLRFSAGRFATGAGGSVQRRSAKTAFDFCASHRGLDSAGKPGGCDLLCLPVDLDAGRRAALCAGLRPAHLTSTL